MKWKRWRENNKPEALSIQQNFRTFGNSGKWYRNFPKKFPEIAETVEIRNAILSIENSRNFGSKVEWKENFGEKYFSKIWVYLVRLPPFLEIPENAVPLATGSCQKFKPEVLVECKVPKILLKKE